MGERTELAVACLTGLPNIVEVKNLDHQPAQIMPTRVVKFRTVLPSRVLVIAHDWPRLRNVILCSCMGWHLAELRCY